MSLDAKVKQDLRNEVADLEKENAKLRKALEHISQPDLACSPCRWEERTEHLREVAKRALKQSSRESQDG